MFTTDIDNDTVPSLCKQIEACAIIPGRHCRTVQSGNGHSSVAARVFGELGMRSSIFEFLNVADALRFETTASGIVASDDYFAKAYTKELNALCNGQCCWKVTCSERLQNKQLTQFPNKRRQLLRKFFKVAAEVKLCRDFLTNSLTGSKNYVEKGIKRYELKMCLAGYSSKDSDEQGPHTLFNDSPCQVRMDSTHWPTNMASGDSAAIRKRSLFCARCQLMCGCAIGNACFWSSRPSRLQNMEEWVDFYVDSGDLNRIALLSHFSIRAYQCWMQQGFPIFAPMSITIQMLASDLLAGDVVYYSETFSCAHSSATQTFTLRKPIPVFPQDIKNQPINNRIKRPPRIRLLCVGAYARQVVDPEDWRTLDNVRTIVNQDNELANGFYICLSRVSFYGCHFSNCSRVEDLGRSAQMIEDSALPKIVEMSVQPSQRTPLANFGDSNVLLMHLDMNLSHI